MQINNVDSINSNGGAVPNDSVGIALAVTGVGVTGCWGIASTVHTFISAPIVSTLSIVGGTAATVTGASMMKDKFSFDLKRNSVDVEAQAA